MDGIQQKKTDHNGQTGDRENPSQGRRSPRERMFAPFTRDNKKLVNRCFVCPPIKLENGNPDGTVTDRQLLFSGHIAKDAPALIILEPVAVTPDGREHPKRLCVHLPESAGELRKIAGIIRKQGRLAGLHLNHAGAASNPQSIRPTAKGFINDEDGIKGSPMKTFPGIATDDHPGRDRL
jgi:2,4-dienoyl-CoA reductase-like NADH-dependent reductase (Old Yellow Enzyme family)